MSDETPAMKRARGLCGCHYCEGPFDVDGWNNNYYYCTAKEMLADVVAAHAAGEAKAYAEVRAMVEECLRRAVEDAEAVDPNTDKYMREERDDHVDDFRALLAQLPGDDKPEEPKP